MNHYRTTGITGKIILAMELLTLPLQDIFRGDPSGVRRPKAQIN